MLKISRLKTTNEKQISSKIEISFKNKEKKSEGTFIHLNFVPNQIWVRVEIAKIRK